MTLDCFKPDLCMTLDCFKSLICLWPLDCFKIQMVYQLWAAKLTIKFEEKDLENDQGTSVQHRVVCKHVFMNPSKLNQQNSTEVQNYTHKNYTSAFRCYD